MPFGRLSAKAAALTSGLGDAGRLNPTTQRRQCASLAAQLVDVPPFGFGLPLRVFRLGDNSSVSALANGLIGSPGSGPTAAPCLALGGSVFIFIA